MVEPMGLVETLVALIQITGKIVSVCHEYRSSVKNAPRELTRALDEITGVRNIVERLIQIVDKDKQLNALSSSKAADQPDAPLKKCLSELTALKSILKPKQGLRGKGWTLLWPLKEAEVSKRLDAIARLKGTLQLAMSADNAANMVEILTSIRSLPLILDKVSTLSLNIQHIDQDTSAQKILDWLSAPDMSLKHKNEHEKRSPHTGQWFLQSEAYIAWKAVASSSLWLNGIPGCGKTVLCAAIIEDIRVDIVQDPDAALAYFYFDSNNARTLDVESLLCAFIIQLVYQRGALPKYLERLYRIYQRKDVISGDPHRVLASRAFRPSVKEFEGTLRDMMKDLTHFYIVIDGLDECEDAQQLQNVLQITEKFVTLQETKVHLLAASRTSGAIQACFESLGVQCVHIEPEFVNPDIRRAIQSRFLEDSKIKRWPKSLQVEVETSLMARAQGMFRWAECQMDTLSRCTTPAAVRQNLQSLPKSLNETYLRILEDIDELNRSTTLRLLRWLAFSMQPLRLDELTEALAIEVNAQSRPYIDSESQFLDMYDILDLCSSLITTVKAPSDHMKTSTATSELQVGLAHFSVKEFLVSDFIRTSVCSHFSMEETFVHSFLAKSCLAYLLHVSVPLEIDNVGSFPLMKYAATSWVRHSTASEESWESPLLIEMTQELLSPGQVYYDNWARLYNIDMPWRRPDYAQEQVNNPPLYCAAYLGIEPVCLYLVNKNLDVNAKGGLLGNALNAAAFNGHQSIVRILLDAGAEVNARAGLFETALASAAAAGHEAIVSDLLDKGANVQHGFGDGRADPLFIAASKGYANICRSLLKHGAIDRFNPKANPGSALHAATLGGHRDVVHELLMHGHTRESRDLNKDYGAIKSASHSLKASQHSAAALGYIDILRELMSYGVSQEEALRYAARAGDLDVVKRSLENGADIDSGEAADHQRALQSAAVGGHVAIVKELLARGADPNLESGYTNALSEAASGGSLDVIELLIKAGARLNPKRYRPLTAAAQAGGLKPLQYLLDCGADVNGGALQTAASHGHFSICEELLRHGANIHLIENADLLYAAVQGGSARIVRLLIEKGVKPRGLPRNENEHRDDNDPMCQALLQGNSEIVNVFLDNGTDVNEFLEFGTLLLEAVRLGHGLLAKHLLARGADVNLQKPGDSGAPLLYAVHSGNVEMVRVLLDQQADVNRSGTIYDDQKGFPLLFAAKGGNLQIVKMLLEAGAEVNHQDDQGFSALHAAAGEGQDKILKLLIEEYRADLNARLINGNLPIHSAAMLGNVQCVELLLSAGADVNATNDDNRTPLHWAAENRRWDNVQLLLDKGANPSLKADAAGLTPLDLAQIGRGKMHRWMMFKPLREEPQWTDENLNALFERMGQVRR